ncbi:uncharacterized protein DFL_005960 [Arthrobotrys flagrans]|uniref:Zn(2)-C6 fungal-type domain-containing protein n=1 Tax=Arthrobotrys flagrans TaxID=97331 RepID=A0A436ZZT8_ARTFL|nr:hypothetical protein DFL_005960 [Arthrobotrys flagrans]
MPELEGPLKIKRLKAKKACDQCRRLRTKCQLPEDGPSASAFDAAGSRDRRCTRCARLNIDCTFILPITETRDRRHASTSVPPALESVAEGSTSPTSSSSRPSIVRKHSAAPLPVSQLDPVEQSKAKFGEFLDTCLPIVNSKEISNTTSVLLSQSVRRMVLSFTEPSNVAADNNIQESIRKYFKDKNAITIPSIHNVQSLLFLSLFIDEPGSGAGNKLMTAIRMACSMHWNRPPEQADEDRTTVNYLWWALVSKDIWLYLASGVPPIINYMGFNVPKPQGAPSFFSAFVGISEVVRMFIRRDSIGVYMDGTALEALAAWERLYFAEVYPSASPNSYSHPFDPPAFLRLLHSVVLSLFVLTDHLGFSVKYFALRQQGTVMDDAIGRPSATEYSVGQLQHPYSQPYPTSAGSSYFGYPNEEILRILSRTLSLHMTHPVLFDRWRYLQRFSEIVVLAILRLTHGHVRGDSIVFNEQNSLIPNWRTRCMIKDERWVKILSLVGEDQGWGVVLELCRDFEEDSEETDSGEG